MSFFISSTLGTAVTKADILPGLKTEHSLITLHISKNKNPRGPGFWKLNTSFLLDLEYIKLIKKTVKEISEEYENNDEVNALLVWDAMKMKIRSSSLHYSKIKKIKMKSQETSLEIISLQKTLDESNLSEMEKNQIINETEIRNLQREEISKHKTWGAILRSKSRWYNEGEKNKKYFLSLEKRHYNQKTIKHLQLADTDEAILKEAKSFHGKLYSSTVTQTNDLHVYNDLFFPEGNGLILDEVEQNLCEGPLTETEYIEWSFIEKTLKYYSFWKLFYHMDQAILHRYL